MKIDVEFHIPASIDQVWPYLVEPEKWLEYTPELVERTPIGEGTLEPGARWRSVDKYGPITIEFTDELVSIEEHKSVVWKQSAPWNSWYELTVRPEEDGCVVHCYFEGRPSGKIWFFNLVPNALSSKLYMDDLRRLRDLLQEPNP